MVRKSQYIRVAACFWLGICAVFSLQAQTRLGLHVTREELNIWRQRALSGPYKSRSDVSANSPDDWTRIVNNASAFKANPASFRWNGPQLFEASGAVQKGTGDDVRLQNEPNGNALAHHIRDAAFLLLVDEKRSDRAALKQAVKAELLHATSIGSLNFNNRTFWPSTYYRDINPLFQTMNWFNNYLYAYDYLDIADGLSGETTFSQEERNRINSWLLAAAEFAQQEQDWDVNRLFTNRSSSSADAAYTPLNKQSPAQRNGADLLTHYTASGPGHTIYGLMQTFNNRRMACHRYAALVGIKVGRQTMVESAKRYVKDWIKYSVFTDGTMGEMERWNSTIPDLGWAYCTDVVASAVTIADALARRGDHSLYDYNTSIGLYGTEGSGGQSKNLHKTLKMMYNIAAKRVQWYGTNDKQNCHSSYLIDGETASWKALHDVWLTMANLKYKDHEIKAMYMRQGAGMTPYWSNPTSQGKHLVWTGDWGIFPGLLFMFGQMEDQPSVYLTNIQLVVNPVQIAPLQLTINYTNSTCNNSNNGATTAVASGGVAPYIYAWSNGKTTAQITELAAGNYTVTVTDQQGSRQSKAITISQPTAITITEQVSHETAAGNDGAIAVIVSGGTGTYSYLWSNGATTKDISGLSAGSYSLTVRDANECRATLTVSVEKKGAQLASIQSFTLLNAEQNNVIARHNPIADKDTINLALLPSRTLNIRANTSHDAIGSVRFALNGESNYSTDNAAPYYMVNGALSWVPKTGSYSLTATPYSKDNQQGKSLTISFYIIDQPLEKPQAVEPLLSCVEDNGNGTLTAHLGYVNNNRQAVTIAAGEQNQLWALALQGAGIERFEPGRQEKAFSVTFSDRSTLTWTLTGPDGKERQLTANAASQLCEPTSHAIVPRIVFSPNEDGIDDLWQIENIEKYPDYEVLIFNRNGSKVFQSRPYNNQWDGRFNGAPLLTDSYYYIIHDRKGPVKTGSVTLIR
jgi:gliding motility-associated-like protein